MSTDLSALRTEKLRDLCVVIGGGRLALPAFDELCRRAAFYEASAPQKLLSGCQIRRAHLPTCDYIVTSGFVVCNCADGSG